ncbi:MAG: WYL domain-containing protein, partial [Thermoguttaceae bacterium]|nr:WYL domain-containing protein [Thermoguttaceae bacterium]
WWILGYGPEVEVLEPPPLRELVRTQAEKMLSIYRRNDSPQTASPETLASPENESAPMDAAESE